LNLQDEFKHILNIIYTLLQPFYTISECAVRISDKFVNDEKNQFFTPSFAVPVSSHRPAALLQSRKGTARTGGNQSIGRNGYRHLPTESIYYLIKPKKL
jgi:hypothetical protein